MGDCREIMEKELPDVSQMDIKSCKPFRQDVVQLELFMQRAGEDDLVWK